MLKIIEHGGGTLARTHSNQDEGNGREVGSGAPASQADLANGMRCRASAAAVSTGIGEAAWALRFGRVRERLLMQ